MVKRWRFLVNDYLRGRVVLKRALVLVDSRHGLKPNMDVAYEAELETLPPKPQVA